MYMSLSLPWSFIIPTFLLIFSIFTIVAFIARHVEER
jgi:hypothetical protein